ncbi:MAG: hypothetical protein WCO60_16160 [Verrucomicrobiota bacterium]
MAFNHFDVRGLQARHFVRLAHRFDLAIYGGNHQPGAATIVGNANSTNDAMNPITVPNRVRQTFQYHQCGTFTHEHSIRLVVKWTRLSSGT